VNGRRRLLIFAQIAASIGLLALAAALARPEALLKEIKTADWRLIAASMLFVPALMFVRTARWHLIARTRRPEMTFGESMHSYMAGLTLAVVTPWAAGELARGALAAPHDKAAFVGLTFVDKLIDATSLYLFACAGVVVVAPGWYRAIGLGGAALAAGGWAAAPAMLAILNARLPRSRLTDILRRAMAAGGQVPRRVLATSFALALVSGVVYFCQLYVIMYAFSPSIRPEAVGLYPLITLSRVIPSIGFGVREFVAGALFAKFQYDVTSAAAVDASFVQYVAANVVPAAAWLIASGGFRRFARRQGETRDGDGQAST
jgi:uncharacterized membrane protein YbhN (UPF0104 family)